MSDFFLPVHALDVWMHAFLYVYACLYICMHLFVYVRMSLYMYACVYTYMHAFTYVCRSIMPLMYALIYDVCCYLWSECTKDFDISFLSSQQKRSMAYCTHNSYTPRIWHAHLRYYTNSYTSKEAYIHASNLTECGAKTFKTWKESPLLHSLFGRIAPILARNLKHGTVARNLKPGNLYPNSEAQNRCPESKAREPFPRRRIHMRAWRATYFNKAPFGA